ncbi:MAG: LysO family transporter [Tissierellales bacterium]|jgi:uncharacterized membrane protein YbjE (DUF340 family)|nr:LysO family transporter [Tissierellales bacterium]MBN2826517.1 LysO family transporter [Tissierellales bacterium]
MFNSVWLYLVLLIVGGFLSYKGIIHDKLIKKAGQMQMVFLYMLIFVMGLRLGLDEEVLEALGTIGFKAFLYAIGTILSGILFVHLADRFLIKSSKGEANDR